MSSGLLDLSITLNVTVGALPGVALSTFSTLVTSPVRVVEFEASRCAPGIEASKSSTRFEVWQFLHMLSSGCGRLTWFLPEAKFTSSWQEPHVAAVGLVLQASGWPAAAE